MSAIPHNRICPQCGDYDLTGIGKPWSNLSSRCRCDEPRDCPKCGTELEADGLCAVGCDPHDTLLTECLGDPLLRRDAA